MDLKLTIHGKPPKFSAKLRTTERVIQKTYKFTGIIALPMQTAVYIDGSVFRDFWTYSLVVYRKLNVPYTLRVSRDCL